MVENRQRIQSGGKRKKFAKVSDSCTWRCNKYRYKHHLIVTFYKTLKCYGLKEHLFVLDSPLWLVMGMLKELSC